MWGQSVILKAILERYKWYQSIPLPIRCDSGTNQEKANGHVTPETKDGEEWSLEFTSYREDPKAVQV